MFEKYFFIMYFYIFNDVSILKLTKSLDLSQSNHGIYDEDDKDERIVRYHMRLVASIAKWYKYAGIIIADLVQEGSIGLIQAIENFDFWKSL